MEKNSSQKKSFLKKSALLFNTFLLSIVVFAAHYTYEVHGDTFDAGNAAEARLIIQSNVNSQVHIWREGDTVTLTQNGESYTYRYSSGGVFVEVPSQPPGAFDQIIDGIIDLIFGDVPPGGTGDGFNFAPGVPVVMGSGSRLGGGGGLICSQRSGEGPDGTPEITVVCRRTAASLGNDFGL